MSTTKWETFLYTRTLFGLFDVAIFQRENCITFKKWPNQIIFIYLGNSLGEGDHLDHVKGFSSKDQRFGIFLGSEKYFLRAPKGKFLGCIVSQEKIIISLEKVWGSKLNIRSFLDKFGLIQGFMPGFTSIATLTAMMIKDNMSFQQALKGTTIIKKLEGYEEENEEHPTTLPSRKQRGAGVQEHITKGIFDKYLKKLKGGLSLLETITPANAQSPVESKGLNFVTRYNIFLKTSSHYYMQGSRLTKSTKKSLSRLIKCVGLATQRDWNNYEQATLLINQITLNLAPKFPLYKLMYENLEKNQGLKRDREKAHGATINHCQIIKRCFDEENFYPNYREEFLVLRYYRRAAKLGRPTNFKVLWKGPFPNNTCKRNKVYKLKEMVLYVLVNGIYLRIFH